jgi:UrcA family protein
MISNIATHGTPFAARSAAVLLSCMLVGANALAGQADDQAQMETVKFQELNVGANAGVAALYQRIHSAAVHVCNAGDIRDLANVADARNCVVEAEARAVAQVNLPALTAYCRIKTGQPVAVLAANRTD